MEVCAHDKFAGAENVVVETPEVFYGVKSVNTTKRLSPSRLLLAARNGISLGPKMSFERTRWDCQTTKSTYVLKDVSSAKTAAVTPAYLIATRAKRRFVSQARKLAATRDGLMRRVVLSPRLRVRFVLATLATFPVVFINYIWKYTSVFWCALRVSHVLM